MTDLNLGIIGNCSYSALIDRRARVVWACLPHFDGDPLFCSLLHEPRVESGFFGIDIDDFATSEQRYLENTAILVTTLRSTSGAAVEIVDFAPRFWLRGRYFRPASMVRMLRPVAGSPRVRVRIRPAVNYGADRPDLTRGSNHFRFVAPDLAMRVTTNAPVSYLIEETPFVLEEPLHIILGPDETLSASVQDISREFFERTEEYWRQFTRNLSIPFEWQDAVIRAAITLKLCTFEESGAVIAAMTTSIPEAPDSRRNWDYRYCWLRDAYFVVHALNRLGVTATLEEYLGYLTNLTAGAKDGYLQPVFGIRTDARLDERELDSLAGYRGMGPVRVGNQAYTQVQNDGYGSAILAVTHSFFDRRLSHPGSPDLFRRLEQLGDQAVARYNQPDAGLWELRAQQRVHTFSSVMCWAACDRLAKIAARLNLPDRRAHWRQHADTIRAFVEAQAWNSQLGRFVATVGRDDADASLLLLHELGFLPASDPRFVSTVEQMEKLLRHGPHMYRYTEDEFGRPETAFIICTFWYIDALAAIGRRDEARELFEYMLERRNHVGLLSEDIDSSTGELWGNYPQTYSMVGLINSAMRLSRSWEEAY